MPSLRAGLLLGFFVAGAAFAATPAPTDEGVPLNIDIRSSVDQRWEGVRKHGAVAHGKLYALVSVKDITATASPLIRPLDEVEMVRLLRKELAAHGFTEIKAQQKPEIVLTVTYGRGFLQNPHFEPGTFVATGDGELLTASPSLNQSFRQREPGFEAKAQRAQAEKLFFNIAAWKYPEKRGEKPHLYWRTVMVTDNPDGRDLNLAMPAMLAAGARYFDQHLKEPEVTVNTTMPAGSVKLGPLNVIGEARPGK